MHSRGILLIPLVGTVLEVRPTCPAFLDPARSLSMEELWIAAIPRLSSSFRVDAQLT